MALQAKFGPCFSYRALPTEDRAAGAVRVCLVGRYFARHALCHVQSHWGVVLILVPLGALSGSASLDSTSRPSPVATAVNSHFTNQVSSTVHKGYAWKTII